MQEIPKRLAPSSEVVRRLFLLSGNQCAFPGCQHPIILQDGTYVGEVCHIRAAAPGGERFDTTQSNEERRSFDNLLLLCQDHHIVTNDIDQFPVSKMLEIKSDHEAKFARGLAELESSVGIQITDSIIAFGGSGGAAPGAGGGGGSAIGPGARGGDGGQGGRITNLGDLDVAGLLFAAPDGCPPGVGGCGEAVSGPNSVGGSGGGGGDLVMSRLDGEMLRRLGVTRINVRVGGGGVQGADGQPSGYDLIDDRGNILISVNAPGGYSGDQFNVQSESLANEIRRVDTSTYVKAAFLSNASEIRDGLFSVLSGGWESYTCNSLPQVMSWPLTMQISLGGVRPGGSIKIRIILLDPSGSETELGSFEAARNNVAGNSGWTGTLMLHPNISSAGLWAVCLRTSDRELTRIPIDVRIQTTS